MSDEKIKQESEKMTFEQSMSALEAIVKQLENGDVPLEEALAQFQKGIELSRHCQQALSQAEEVLTKMMTDDDQEVPFERSGE